MKKMVCGMGDENTTTWGDVGEAASGVGDYRGWWRKRNRLERLISVLPEIGFGPAEENAREPTCRRFRPGQRDTGDGELDALWKMMMRSDGSGGGGMRSRPSLTSGEVRRPCARLE